MATFSYLGKDLSGKRVRGLIAADTARSARDRLRTDGVRVETIRQRAEQKQQFSLLQSLSRRRLETPLTDFLRELATLLQAGVPVLESIDSSVPAVRGGLQEPVAALRDKVAGGQSLAEAMEADSWLFDEMTIGMVRVGEHAGNLEEVLDQVATFREQAAQLKDRVLSAVLYPAIVFFVSIAVTLFLMTVVVPMLLKNLAELGSELPLPTRILKVLSDSLLLHGWWAAILLAFVAFLTAAWMRTENGKLQVSRFLLRLPLIGMLIRKQAIGRTALVIACLLRSGVELVEALTIAAHSCSNVVLRRALLDVTAELQRGADLKSSFQKHTIFPNSVAQVFALGQQSGKLEGMLQRLGEDYDRQAGILASRVASIAEPALILMLSVMVGFILFATVLPILEAGNVLAG